MTAAFKNFLQKTTFGRHLTALRVARPKPKSEVRCFFVGQEIAGNPVNITMSVVSGISIMVSQGPQS